MDSVRLTIKGKTYDVSVEKVRQIAADFDPKNVTDYYVEFEEKRFPTRQLIRLATESTDSPGSYNAIGALIKLGFTVRYLH